MPLSSMIPKVCEGRYGTIAAFRSCSILRRNASFPYDGPATCLLYDAQSVAVSLGDLDAFSAPQDDV